MSSNVLILGGGLQALSAAYSLHKCQYQVYCIASDKEEVKRSRFVNTFYPLDSDDTLKQVLSVIRKENISVVIPMSDKMSELVSMHKSKIETVTGHVCQMPEHSIFEQAANKSKLMSFCEQHHFSHPRTLSLAQHNLIETAEYVGFPSMIKPNHSVGARGITLVRSLDELQFQYPKIVSKYGDSTLQEYVDCEGLPYYNVMLYRNSEGKILGSTIIEIIRYFPIHGGSSSLCRTIEEPKLLNECSSVLDRLNWIGMADFDVLINKEGEYKIIEINPRVPASLRAADIAGVNFPEIIVRDTLKLQTKTYTYKTNKYLRYLGLDLMWFLKSPTRLSARPNWFLSFGKNFYFQDIYANDCSTWASWLTAGIKRFIEKRQHIRG